MSELQKGPSAWESGDSETIFFLFSGGLTVSLVTVRLTDLHFLFFFISVLGEVVATGGDGPVLAVLGAELPPFEALTEFLLTSRKDWRCSWPVGGRRWLGPWGTGDRGKAP